MQKNDINILNDKLKNNNSTVAESKKINDNIDQLKISIPKKEQELYELIKQNLLKIKTNNLSFKNISFKELDFIIMSTAFIKMTRKEQNKILDDKIKANKRQYGLDRTNAEISAYSSGDLPEYEYLTKKDLGYKPHSFEQAKFEYSPLGKVFIDGLDKSDKKEEILKKLKSIENKSNDQLLALGDIFRPAIIGKDNSGYESRDDENDDDDYNRAYETIVDDYKNNKIKYKYIKNELDRINNTIKIYEKNKKYYKDIPIIKEQINKNKKFAKVLRRIIDEIIKNKICKNTNIGKIKLLIYHGLVIQNCLIKLTKMLQINTKRLKKCPNYYLFKTF